MGVGILGAALWQMREPAARTHALQRAGAVVACFALFSPASNLGRWILERVRLSFHRSGYERVVASLEQGIQDPSSLDSEDVDYIVDSGPPLRVAFSWPGGIIDNWCGIVHDPTGDVLKVNELKLGSDQWRRSEITKLFGGDMVSCRAVELPYFLCCFT
jgi:hypothetical protein